MKRFQYLIVMATLMLSFTDIRFKPASGQVSTTAASNTSAMSVLNWRWFSLPDGPAWVNAGSWDQAPYYSTIQTADLNGDGREELLARSGESIVAYEFDPRSNAWDKLPNGPGWSDAGGWDQAQYYSTIQTADLNGDGRADLLARSADGIVAYEFDPGTNAWVALPDGPGWSDAGGWDQAQYYNTIQTADLNGDGRADLLARSADGIVAYEFDPGTHTWVKLPDGPGWSDTAGWDQAHYYSTIQTADLNGNGRADLLARSALGILDYEFDPGTHAWVKLPDGPGWSDAANWNQPQYYGTIQTADLNGDGRVELLARGPDGILVNEFNPGINAWVALPDGPGWSDTGGWDQVQYYSTIQTADLNGDGRADLLARSGFGIVAYEFDPDTNAWMQLPDGPGWSDTAGWDTLPYYSTIQTADLDGDGRGDLLARSPNGILAYGFDPDPWIFLPDGPGWSDTGGWDQAQYYSTIQTADLNGDGRADLLARSADGIVAYEFDPGTNAWVPLPNGPGWSDTLGWDQAQFYSTIQTADLNGDGRADLLARGASGIVAYEFDPGTHAWVKLPDGPGWSDALGWDQTQYYSTIQTADLNGDGRADLLARSALGIVAYEFDPGTNAWVQLPDGPGWSDAAVWDETQYYGTIQTADLNGDGRADLLARGPDGILVDEFDPGINAWVALPDGPGWSDVAGWDQPEYYNTIQTGDLNGDGRADLLARVPNGILAYEFDPDTNAWVQLPDGPGWNNVRGWNQPKYYSTIQTADIDGDGLAELLARGPDGILAYKFNPVANAWVKLVDGPGWSDAGGWNLPQYYRTIQSADIDGNGDTELLVRASNNILAVDYQPQYHSYLPLITK